MKIKYSLVFITQSLLLLLPWSLCFCPLQLLLEFKNYFSDIVKHFYYRNHYKSWNSILIIEKKHLFLVGSICILKLIKAEVV